MSDILFVALNEMKITNRLDAYLTNVSFPWDKKTDTHVTVGALLVYKVNFMASMETWSFDRIWVKSFPN
jgi:hypothetical protein